MKKKPILSKGLQALLAQDDLEVTEFSEIQEISLEQIDLSDLQPRISFSQAKLEELASSIKEFGVLQPIIVRFINGRYELVAGERRFRACKIAAIKKIPAKILSLTTQQALSIAIVENIQRSDLNVIEEAKAYNRLLSEYNYSHQQIANVLGKSRSEITNKLQVLKLELKVQDLLAKDQISFGHAKLLTSLASETQLLYANKVVAENLSVRQLEGLLRVKKKPKKVIDINIIALQNRIAQELGAEVSIDMKKNKSGKFTIKFPDLDFLNALLTKLK